MPSSAGFGIEVGSFTMAALSEPTSPASRDEVVRWLRAQPERADFLRDCYLDVPPVGAAERFFHSEEWREALHQIKDAPGRALDLGGGHGIASYALARSGWSVAAIEPSSSSVTGARAIATLAEEADLPTSVTRAVGEHLPFANSSFDVVYSRQVLHHVCDKAELCREVRRVLRPGGLYLACAEHVVSSERQRQSFLRKHPLNRYTDDENAFRVADYRHAFSTGGLELVTVFRSFDSAINYSPFTRSSLRTALAERLHRLPGGSLAVRLALGTRSYPVMLRVLSWTDARPGRVYSFLARRPAESERPCDGLV